jgi:hypothetical protein
VPDADRVVPIVFFADSYLAGAEAIGGALRTRLEQKPGSVNLLTGLLPPENQYTEAVSKLQF